MNRTEAKNFFLKQLDENITLSEELFKLAIKCAKKSETVLFISFKEFKSAPEVEISTDVFKHIIFMYFDTIQQITLKILELHSWAILPKVIILNFDDYFDKNLLNNEIIKNFCLLVASLFNYVSYLDETLMPDQSKSILYVRHSEKTSPLIEILIELYFYKTYKTIDDLVIELDIQEINVNEE